MHWLIETDIFMPRSCCGAWQPWELWLYAIGNGLLFLGYAAVLPVTLVAVWSRWQSLGPLTRLCLWFGAFIFFCGLYHGLDVLALRAAPYRLITLVGLLASVATWGTIWQLWLHRKLLAEYPTPEQWEAEAKAAKDRAAVESERARSLEGRCDDLESQLAKAHYRGKVTEQGYADLKRIAQQIREL